MRAVLRADDRDPRARQRERLRISDGNEPKVPLRQPLPVETDGIFGIARGVRGRAAEQLGETASKLVRKLGAKAHHGAAPAGTKDISDILAPRSLTTPGPSWGVSTLARP